MPCFQLKDVFGQTRWVEQGVGYNKVNGEKIVEGAIDWECGAPLTVTPPVKFHKCSKCHELGVYEST